MKTEMPALRVRDLLLVGMVGRLEVKSLLYVF